MLQDHQRAFTVPAVQAAPAPATFEEDARQMLADWYRVIRRKFADAPHEPTDFGKRFIENGAVCMWNCAQDLERLLERQAGQAPRDLGLEVVQQDPKGP
ncbi:MAG: hypothetical protein A3G82_07300 [Burkholderiales bacterium RIFCSPLOWO2_12_FULL_67_210]|nr:MAG: hypothetical protein A3G82_07300 [Burkholderiales bacterium RIFCSPLOWO2_12_FULL_67_210]